jgi:hypothetical protein
MSDTNKKKDTKCVAVHLPLDLLKKIDRFKEISGDSKNSILVQLIEDGLDKQN